MARRVRTAVLILGHAAFFTSWPGLSGPPIAARAGIASRESPDQVQGGPGRGRGRSYVSSQDKNALVDRIQRLVPAIVLPEARESAQSAGLIRLILTTRSGGGSVIPSNPSERRFAQSAIPPSPWPSVILVLPYVVKPACLTQGRTPQSRAPTRQPNNRPRITHHPASKSLTRSGVLSSCALRAKPSPNN
jgi:hypothetical protein